MFQGVATRHALVDGNKRHAWQSLTVFLALNDLYLDAPEQAAFEIGMAVITKDRTVDDLAALLEPYLMPLRTGADVGASRPSSGLLFALKRCDWPDFTHRSHSSKASVRASSLRQLRAGRSPKRETPCPAKPRNVRYRKYASVPHPS
ncbi:MAG: hypothetical protein ACLFTG_07035 [Alphaproteobacteria bacterium]